MDSLSLVCGDLEGCAVWSLVGLPLISCPAVHTRAHRLGAPNVVRYPSGAGDSWIAPTNQRREFPKPLGSPSGGAGFGPTGPKTERAAGGIPPQTCPLQIPPHFVEMWMFSSRNRRVFHRPKKSGKNFPPGVLAKKSWKFWLFSGFPQKFSLRPLLRHKFPVLPSLRGEIGYFPISNVWRFSHEIQL